MYEHCFILEVKIQFWLLISMWFLDTHFCNDTFNNSLPADLCCYLSLTDVASNWGLGFCTFYNYAIQLQNVYTQILKDEPPVDVIVNSAGITHTGTFIETSDDIFEVC